MGTWYWIGVCAGLGRRARRPRGRRPSRPQGRAPCRPGRRGRGGLAARRAGGRGRRRDRRRARHRRRGADRSRCAGPRRHPRAAPRCSSASPRSSSLPSRSFRCSATSSRSRCPCSGSASAGAQASATQVSGSLPATKALLIVIDGLTPAMYEDAVERRTAPALAELHERGEYRRAATVFPSLTPVCLSSLVTGAYPDVHEIPHLVWYHRGEQRLVEYGSSFAALRRAGTRRGILDAIFRMNEEHLSRNAVTLYESVEDAGRVAAAVNIICYRGRTPHVARIPGVTRAAHGPKRFFFFNLFESDETGAPFRPGTRRVGGNDKYAGAVGRWLVTRDGFDLLVYYLPDYDYASHAAGPDAAHTALTRADDAVRALLDAAGGVDALLDRYAVVVCSDHGQTRVDRPTSLHESFAGVDELVVTASNRAGMVYDLRGGRARELAQRLDRRPRRGDRALPRERRARRTPRRRRGARRARRLSGRPRARDGGAAQPEQRRRARVGRSRLRIHRPRRPAPRRRRQPRLAASQATPRFRCSRSGSDQRLRASPVSRRFCSTSSVWSARTTRARSAMPDRAEERRLMVEQQLRNRDVADERVLDSDGTCAAARLRPRGAPRPRLRRRGAADRLRPDDLAAVHGRPNLRGALAARGRAGPRRRHRLGLPGRGARRARGRGAHDRAAPGARGGRASLACRRPDTATGCTSTSATAPSGSPSRRRSAQSRWPPQRPSFRRASTSSSSRAGRLVVPVGKRHGQQLQLIVRSPEGPAVVRSVSCRFVPLLGEEGFAV